MVIRCPNALLEGPVDHAALAAVVEEIAPLVEGRTVVDAHAPTSLSLVITLSGDPRRSLGVVAMKALPVVFLTDRLPEREDGPGAGGLPRELVGARVISFAACEGEPVAELRLTRTDIAGRIIERTLRIDVGRRPAVSLDDARGREREDRGGERSKPGPHRALPAPSVGWRRDAGGRLHVRLGPLGGNWDGTREFESWNAAAVHAFHHFFPELRLERRRRQVARIVERELRRKLRAVEKVRTELADAGRAGEYRHKAQLLLTRQKDIRKGVTPVRVFDYDNSTPIEIEVDPALPAARNAEILFRRARKAERRAVHGPGRLTELELNAEKLRGRLEKIAEASPRELERLEAEILPPRAAEAGDREGPRARFRTYTVSGGWEVLVGKSNRDNDVLTHRIARPDDLWFHVRQAAGSHVILRRAGRKSEPDADAIREAASIAAYHSKAGRSSNVPVCYTERRHVRKPRGAKPGLAVVSRETVVFVDPRLPESAPKDGA